MNEHPDLAEEVNNLELLLQQEGENEYEDDEGPIDEE